MRLTKEAIQGLRENQHNQRRSRLDIMGIGNWSQLIGKCVMKAFIATSTERLCVKWQGDKDAVILIAVVVVINTNTTSWLLSEWPRLTGQDLFNQCSINNLQLYYSPQLNHYSVCRTLQQGWLSTLVDMNMCRRALFSCTGYQFATEFLTNFAPRCTTFKLESLHIIWPILYSLPPPE